MYSLKYYAANTRVVNVPDLHKHLCNYVTVMAFKADMLLLIQ